MTAPTIKNHPLDISNSDDREYRYVELENELQVLLVSDPTTEKSAAAMDVHVGSYSDQLAGEAHFLEHMLFMGTTKYPNENDYNNYLNKHGGSSNAYTDLENTNYSLDVNPDALQGALDRFAQFFIDPLLKPEALERERQAVDSEHAKNLQSDQWRYYQLTKSLASKDHPYSKFGTGNAQSLLTVSQESLKQFYENNYSANRMALVVFGKEHLDQLQAWVETYFAGIPNRYYPKQVFPGNPFSDILPLELQVIPVKQEITLDLQFALCEVETLYKTKPARYLSHLLGHESRGSLLFCMKQRHWAHDLSAGIGRGCSDWSAFSIHIVLTEQGFENWQLVVELVFSYLQMLRLQGPQEWVYEEVKEVADCTFRFLSKQEPFDYTSSLAHDLHVYEPHHVLSGAYRYYDYQPKLIEQCLSYMRPDNVIIIRAHPTAFEGKTTETEQWYGVKYNAIPISKELQDQWSNAPINDELHLPERNDMIATDFELKVVNFTELLPVLLHDSPTLRLWWKPDNVFHMPKTNLLVALQTTVAYESPASTVLLTLWQLALQEHCNDFTYLASMAGLYCDLHVSRSGLEITLTGYNHKMDRLALRIVQAMKELDLTEDIFERLKTKHRQELENFAFAAPYHHAMYGVDRVMLEHKHAVEDKLEALATMKCEDVVQFGRDLNRFRLELLVHGNVVPEEATRLADIFVEGLQPQNPFRLWEDRVVQLSPNTKYVYRFAGYNPSNTNSVTELLIPMGLMNFRENAKLAFVHHVLKEPAFHVLRTQQQLGYIVHTAVWTGGAAVKGLLLLIQSDAYDPITLDERLSAFLEQVRSEVSKDFEEHRAAVVQLLRESPKNLLQESSRYWDAISKRLYVFDRLDRIADRVEELTPADVLQFFDHHLGRDCCQLSVQVFGCHHGDRLTDEVPPGWCRIDNVVELKRTSSLYPLPAANPSVSDLPVR